MLRGAISITAALLFAVAGAQVSTVSLFLIDTDPQTLFASVITANPSTTQYLIGCATGTAMDDCGYFPAATITHAGSVYGGGFTTADPDLSLSYKCTYYTTSGTSAVCSYSVGGSSANYPGEGMTTVTGAFATLLPVTVTAGANLLASPTSSRSGSNAGGGTAGVTLVTSNNIAPTAGVGMGLAGLAAVAMVL